MAFLYSLDPAAFLVIALAAFLLGVAKTSFPTAGVLIVPLLALVLESRTAAGILLPVYAVGDAVALIIYRKQAQPRRALVLLPWAAIGMAAAVLFGATVDEETFRRVLGGLVLLTVALSASVSGRGEPRLPAWLAPPIGIVAGFTTMIGNAAGPIMTVYFLLMGLTTSGFVGTASIFFLIVNLSKIPVHLFLWHSYPAEALLVSGIALPVVLAGTWAGAGLLRKVTPRMFRLIMLIAAGVAGLRLLFA